MFRASPPRPCELGSVVHGAVVCCAVRRAQRIWHQPYGFQACSKTVSPPASVEAASRICPARQRTIRQVLAAHFVRDCPHVVEIGGHLRPVTAYLTHQPLSVLSVDPKTAPYEADTLMASPAACAMWRASSRSSTTTTRRDSYGLVLLGYSLKPFGGREPLGAMLFSLIDNARSVVHRVSAGARTGSHARCRRSASRPDIAGRSVSFDLDPRRRGDRALALCPAAPSSCSSPPH